MNHQIRSNTRMHGETAGTQPQQLALAEPSLPDNTKQRSRHSVTAWSGSLKPFFLGKEKALPLREPRAWLLPRVPTSLRPPPTARPFAASCLCLGSPDGLSETQRTQVEGSGSRSSVHLQAAKNAADSHQKNGRREVNRKGSPPHPSYPLSVKTRTRGGAGLKSNVESLFPCEA